MATGQEPEREVSPIGQGADVPDVRLAPVSLEHAEAMARWMADAEIARGLGLRREPSLDGTRAWIERAEADPTCHPFAILAAGTHVGNVVLDLLDSYLGTARLSIYLGERSARGTGVARKALVLAAEHGQALGLHKLWLTVHVGNSRAIALYARAGFLVEGVHRDEFMLDGRRTDVLRMGLLLGERTG